MEQTLRQTNHFIYCFCTLCSIVGRTFRIRRNKCVKTTYQDSGNNISAVLQSVRVVTAGHVGRRAHKFLILIPVTHLRKDQIRDRNLSTIENLPETSHRRCNKRRCSFRLACRSRLNCSNDKLTGSWNACGCFI